MYSIFFIFNRTALSDGSSSTINFNWSVLKTTSHGIATDTSAFALFSFRHHYNAKMKEGKDPRRTNLISTRRRSVDKIEQNIMGTLYQVTSLTSSV